MITSQEEENTVAALKRVLAPFTLCREAHKTFHVAEKKEEFMIWLPLSPWQEVLCDTVREKEVERWAGTFGINPMNGLCSVLRSCTTHPSLIMDFFPGNEDYPVSAEFMQVSSKIELLDRLTAKLIHCKHKTVVLVNSDASMKA